jgi:hypothetical protein
MNKPYQSVDNSLTVALNTNAQPDVDYSKSIFDSLPPNAQKYFREKSNMTLDQIVSKLSVGEKAKKYTSALSFLTIIPFCYLRYANGNQLLPVLINGQHKLLKGPCFHWQTGITDKVGSPVDISNDVIFGSIKLVYVKPGELKYALNTETSLPILLGPGIHFFDDNSIIVNETPIKLSSNGDNALIPVGTAFNFAFVKAGSQALVNSRSGELRILDAGLHFIEAPDNFSRFVSVQQEHFKFGSCDQGTPVFLTADNVELHVHATLFYNVSDARKVYSTSIKDANDLYETLHSQAMATLMTIIRSENFSNIGKKKMDASLASASKGIERQVNFKADEKLIDVDAVPVQVAMPIPSAPPAKDTLEDVTIGFQSIIHDAEPRFKATLQENFGDRIGINIQSLRIEKIEFADKTMQKQVSELAMTYTKLSAQEATITAQRKVEVAQAEREAATRLIKAKMEADAKMIEQDNNNEITIRKTKLDNDLMLQTATAKANATKIETDTTALNKVTLAKAEAQSILEVGQAEVEIIKRKGELPEYPLRIMAESQEKVLSGVQKVIYTDKQPFLMQSLTTLQDPVN